MRKVYVDCGAHSMINDGTIKYVNKLWLETHEDKIGLKESDKSELYRVLKEDYGLAI